jgi:hypothetical protein
MLSFWRNMSWCSGLKWQGREAEGLYRIWGAKAEKGSQSEGCNMGKESGPIGILQAGYWEGGGGWSVRRNSDIPLSWWSMKTVLFDISGPDDGGSTHLWNIGPLQQDCVMLWPSVFYTVLVLVCFLYYRNFILPSLVWSSRSEATGDNTWKLILM